MGPMPKSGSLPWTPIPLLLSKYQLRVEGTPVSLSLYVAHITLTYIFFVSCVCAPRHVLSLSTCRVLC